MVDIPVYHRPIGARKTTDINELGGPVYQTPLGRKFTFLGEPETRQVTLSERATAYKDALAKISIPSWDELTQGVAAVVQGLPSAIRDQIGDLRQTMFADADLMTTEDALRIGMAGAGVSAPFEVPKGALRVFGGRSAQTAPDFDSFSGTADELWQQHGVFKLPDGEWRFEIRDTDMKLTPSARDDLRALLSDPDSLKDNESLEINLGDVLDHPALFEAYPFMKEYRLKLYISDPEDKGWSFQNTVALNYRNLDANDPLGPDDQSWGTLVHEIQHAIQDIEGFDTGANPGMFTAKRAPTPTQIDQFERLRDHLEKLPPGSYDFNVLNSSSYTYRTPDGKLQVGRTPISFFKPETIEKWFGDSREFGLQQMERELDLANAIIEGAEEGLSPMRMYQRTLGEQEAEIARMFSEYRRFVPHELTKSPPEALEETLDGWTRLRSTAPRAVERRRNRDIRAQQTEQGPVAGGSP